MQLHRVKTKKQHSQNLVSGEVKETTSKQTEVQGNDHGLEKEINCLERFTVHPVLSCSLASFGKIGEFLKRVLVVLMPEAVVHMLVLNNLLSSDPQQSESKYSPRIGRSGDYAEVTSLTAFQNEKEKEK